MTKNLIKLIALLFVVGTQSLSANVSASNKSFLLPRPPGREHFVDHVGWYRTKRHADNLKDEKIGFSFQVAGFYRQSVQKDRLGGYLGASNKSKLKFGHSSSAPDRSQVDIPSQNMIHKAFEYFLKCDPSNNELFLDPNVTTFPTGSVDSHVRVQDLAHYSSATATAPRATVGTPPGNDPGQGPFTWATVRLAEYNEKLSAFRNDSKNAPSGEISLQPQSQAYGIRLGFYANVPNFGYLRVNVPVVKVDNSLGLKFTDVSSENFQNFLMGLFPGEGERDFKALPATTAFFDDEETSGPGAPPASTYKTEYQVFKNPAANQANAQEALTKGKLFLGKKKGKFGVGDIDITLGRRIADAEHYDMATFLTITAPASKSPTGEFLFEPIRGNGSHVEFGGGVEGTVDLCKSEDFSIEAMYNIGMGYIFKSKETRTFDSFMDAKIRMPWQRYFLVGEKDTAGALIPFANVSTLPVDVRPGFKIEGFAGLGFLSEDFSVDLGYAFWAKEAEKVRLRGDWADDKYTFPNAADYRTYEAVSLDSTSPHTFGASNNTTIQKTELDLSSPATPGQLSQAFWGAATYIVRTEGYPPLALTVGADYEFGQDAATLSTWMVFGKLSVSF